MGFYNSVGITPIFKWAFLRWDAHCFKPDSSHMTFKKETRYCEKTLKLGFEHETLRFQQKDQLLRKKKE